MLTLRLFYEITERVEWKFWSFKKKTQNKRRHNEKGLMFVLPGYKFRHDIFINAENHGMNGFHAVNNEMVSMVWTCRFARKWTGLRMGVLLNGHLPWVFLTFKKHLSSSLEPSQPSYLAGISLELHLVAAWPYKPHRTGCEGPVQSMSARSVHYIRMSVPLVPTTSLWSASL